MGRTVA